MAGGAPEGATGPTRCEIAGKLLKGPVGQELLAEFRGAPLDGAGSCVAQALGEPRVTGVGVIGNKFLGGEGDRFGVFELCHLVEGGKTHDELIVLHDRSVKKQLEGVRVISECRDGIAPEGRVFAHEGRLVGFGVESPQSAQAPQGLNGSWLGGSNHGFQPGGRTLSVAVNEKPLRGLPPEQVVAVQGVDKVVVTRACQGLDC